jgi:cell volume regulation protein A
MASLDTVSIGILLGALLLLAGILSSLVAMRFGAPLLLVFLILGMLGGGRVDAAVPPCRGI